VEREDCSHGETKSIPFEANRYRATSYQPSSELEHNLITNAMSRVRPSVQGVADTGGVGVSEGFLSRIGETLDER
jgi:hypothetical protein